MDNVCNLLILLYNGIDSGNSQSQPETQLLFSSLWSKKTVCSSEKNSRFISLGDPNNVWAIPAIHSETEKLVAIHDTLYDLIRPGDRLVYMGNYTGFGPDSGETIDEILTFRRLVLARPGMKTEDIVYLRGGQEEMLCKLLQLQFAPNPEEVLLWMLGNGMRPTLESYGICAHEGITAAREGVMSLTRWTAAIRNAIRKHAGHQTFYTQLKRAAFTEKTASHPILFVHAGLNPRRPLDEQGDSLWWSRTSFNEMTDPYRPFDKVVRGFDPKHAGVHINCVTATIDNGCGFGGGLVSAGFDRAGRMFELLET